MQYSLRICLAQMSSVCRHDGNIAFVQRAATYARQHEADLLALPEVAGMMNRNLDDARPFLRQESDDPFIKACRSLAKEHNLWIHTGSTPLLSDHETLLRNTSHLIDSDGHIQARYTKIHLFDIFPEGRPAICESARYSAGTEAVIVATPWGPWGMSICYDLRFPRLYRDYAQAGATLVFVPSAFTRQTGEAHWEVLLRARAIENGFYVAAAAQVGTHEDGRSTWGHSLLVDPWGRVLAERRENSSGLQMVEIDIRQVAQTRAQIPSLRHEKEYILTSL